MDLPNPVLAKVTERVIARSQKTRSAYLQRIEHAQGKFPARGALSCATWLMVLLAWKIMKN